MSGEEPDVETGQRILADSESDSSTNESAKDIRSISSEIDIQIEESTESTVGVNFVKIHAPWEVLTRYAEIIKMKMLMKEETKYRAW
ncbi:anoctamin-1-like isoform X2 [Tachypleus tridentatus]|uniref:anoctamin-1-like isoform X2 n=1 Tax=Tachypleus tridentatus TaxID=6853 RepID=UPI003FD5E2F8